MSVAITGLSPAVAGRDWFLIDKSGEFSFGSDVMAEIWLVGGGCDGKDGCVGTDGFVYGGKGGDGGAVFKFGRIKIAANTPIIAEIAEANDPVGTSVLIGDKSFGLSQLGCTQRLGERGGIISPDGGIIQSFNGKNGVLTPYGMVGSSGGGGACARSISGRFIKTGVSIGGYGAGSSQMIFDIPVSWDEVKNFLHNIDAVNYGCGGAGNIFCQGIERDVERTRGKGGCVIFKYVLLDSAAGAYDCVIRYWGEPEDTDDVSALKSKIEALSDELGKLTAKNAELKRLIGELEK